MSRPLPKLLLLSWHIPPSTTGQAIVNGSLAQQFTPAEMVLVGSEFRDSSPLEWNPGVAEIVYATSYESEPSAGRRGAWARLPRLFLVTLWVMMTRRCQAMLVSFPEETHLLVGYLVSVLTRKPLYGYFHNTYLEVYSSKVDPQKRFPRWLQGVVFKRVKHMFVMSEGMQDYYREAYPTLPASPLLHTFNEPLPKPDELPDTAQVNTPLQLIMAGNMNYSNSGAARDVGAAVRLLPDCHLTLINRSKKELIAQLGLIGEQITHLSGLSRADYLNKLRNADILILPHGFDPDFADEEIKTIFPTRTIEYLLTGRPILAHLPADTFLARFLQKYDCALLVTENSGEAVAAGIRQLVNDAALRQRLAHNAIKAAEQFHAPTVAQHLRDVVMQTYYS